MKKLLTGNEAVAQGAYEAGVTYAAAYPGTPSTEILENLAGYKEDIIAEWAPNEKVALECAIGASIAGARALCAMKMVGVNVAADPMFSFAYSGVNGGMMIVSADDPGLHSSQNEQDNRYYARFAKIAMLEPSDSMEAKEMVKAAMQISEAYDTPILFRMTTRICHSKSLVEIGERQPVAKKDYVKNLAKYDLVPANARKLHIVLEDKLKRLEAFSNATDLNYFIWNDRRIGVISAGVAFQYAREVFGDTVSYLKLGLTHPLPMEKIRAFAEQVDTLYVVEELEPYMEEHIRAAGINCIGKEKIPNVWELTPDIVARSLLGQEAVKWDIPSVPGRPPTLCAGCPHRAFHVELARLKNVVITGDIGCYSLGGSEPLNAQDTTICMGASISMGHGAQKIFDHFDSPMRTIAVIGDSTFFHTGINSLMQVAYNRSNTITCILDNRVTGMTGHQDNPGTGFTLQGMPTREADIPAIAHALGIDYVRTVNPLELKEVREALQWALKLDEPSVIIARYPCVLKKFSQADIEEFGVISGKCEIDVERCNGCGLCLRCGCPALVYDAVADLVTIDETQCDGCELCLQICKRDAIKKVS
jgi:indolepyruvate ferredoxin oxidoreductase alpha subunit